MVTVECLVLELACGNSEPRFAVWKESHSVILLTFTFSLTVVHDSWQHSGYSLDSEVVRLVFFFFLFFSSSNNFIIICVDGLAKVQPTDQQIMCSLFQLLMHLYFHMLIFNCACFYSCLSSFKVIYLNAILVVSGVFSFFQSVGREDLLVSAGKENINMRCYLLYFILIFCYLALKW